MTSQRHGFQFPRLSGVLKHCKGSKSKQRKRQRILFLISEIFLKNVVLLTSPLLTVSACFFLSPSSTGMASAVRLPPFRRPQNVSAALPSSDAVRYRCHAAPLRPQRHGESGQQHHRVSGTRLENRSQTLGRCPMNCVVFSTANRC